jgi:phosphoribosyl 1,2-cyclic phosphate phosphodiesterase
MLRTGIDHLDALIFTHGHKDHTAGLDDIRAFNFIQGTRIEVYATPDVQEVLRREFRYIFDGTDYPGIPQIKIMTIGNKPFLVDEVEVIPVETLHYKLPVLGFRIGDFTYITDANYIPKKEKEKVKGSRVIVLNALRKTHHISHFTLDEAVELMNEFKPEKGFFTHISHQLGLHTAVNDELPASLRLAHDQLVVEL